MKILVDRVIQNLRASGMTYKDIAKEIGVSASAVSCWAAGTKTLTDYRTIIPLLDLHFDKCHARHTKAILVEGMT